MPSLGSPDIQFYLTYEQQMYINMINLAKDKDLIRMCIEKNVKKSYKGVSNKYVRRINLIEKFCPHLDRHLINRIAEWGETKIEDTNLLIPEPHIAEH
jgi:hypothetical protein